MQTHHYPTQAAEDALREGLTTQVTVNFQRTTTTPLHQEEEQPLVLHQGFHKEEQDFPKEGRQWRETILQPEKLMKISKMQKKKQERLSSSKTKID